MIMNSTRQIFVLFLLLLITSAAQARLGNFVWHTDLLQADAVSATVSHNAATGMPSQMEINACASTPEDVIGANITVNDYNGSRVHVMKFLHVKVEYSLKSGDKIGTIVITDLRMGDIPSSALVIHNMSISDLTMNAGMTWWVVSNTFGQTFTGKEGTYYLSIQDGKILIKE